MASWQRIAERNEAEVKRLQSIIDIQQSALEVLVHVVGHNSCSDGKSPNGFVVALEKGRTALRLTREPKVNVSDSDTDAPLHPSGNPKLNAFVSELTSLVERHEASISYTTDDDGIHVSVPGSEDVCLGWGSAFQREDSAPILPAKSPKSSALGA